MNEQSHSTITIAAVKQLFDDVHESLQAESGYGLDAQTREDAWRQVQMYWNKLQDQVASRVTETEVPLTLMNNVSPSNRKFTIHGVVDVVQEQDKIILYDIKSHDYQRLHENIDSYGPQLQVYAYIWSELRGQTVDETCIINTDPPDSVKAIVDFLHMTDVEQAAFERWNPVIPITNFSAALVHETIAKFGMVVDAIEEHKFNPPDWKELERNRLRLPVPLMCAKCDVRYSCTSYRQLVIKTQNTQNNLMRFYDAQSDIKPVREIVLPYELSETDDIMEEFERTKDDVAANFYDDNEAMPF
jgi:hypothetical protein